MLSQNVTLHLVNTTVKRAFVELKQKAGISVLFNDDIIDTNKKVTLRLNNVHISTAMKHILKGQKNLRWDIEGDVVIVRKAIKKSSARTINTGKSHTENYESLDKVLTWKDELQEFVVIGYGSIRKSDISGSTTSIDGNEASRRSSISVQDMLQGEAAGVIVNNYNNSPGSVPSVLIRGYATINNSTSPLYVVDGVQVDTDISFINPEDVDKIEILKDASATAMYGARGANGVIIINTKRGSGYPLSLTAKIEKGIGSLCREQEVLNADEYASAIRIARKNDGNVIVMPIWSNSYDGMRKNINWQKQLTSNFDYTKYNLSFSGGNKSLSGYFSAGYINNTGLVVSTNYSKYNIHASIESIPRSNFKIGATVDYSNSKYGNEGSNMLNYVISPPTMDYTDNQNKIISPNVVNPDGSYGTFWQFSGKSELGTGSIDNLYAQKKQSLTDINLNGMLARVNAEIHILNRLMLNSVVSFLKRNHDSNYFNEEWHRFNYIHENDNIKLTEIPLLGIETANTLRFVKEEHAEMAAENNITYNFHNALNNLTLMLGSSVSKTEGSYLSSSARNLPMSTVRDIGINGVDAKKQAYGKFDVSSRFISYYSRVMYGYMGRYNMTASIRHDGSSHFSKNNRWGTFPSFAASWRISEEPFLQNKSWLSNLKLRFGWGQTGNSGIISNMNVKQLSNDNIRYKFYPDGNSTQQGTSEIGIAEIIPGDENLKWEKNSQLNLGVDLMFAIPSIRISLDYYIRHTHDLLVDLTMRPSTGYQSLYTNSGDILNRGLEFSLDTKLNVRNVNISTTLVASTNTNKIRNLGNDIFSNQYYNSGMHWDKINLFRNGYAMGTWYGYKTDGIYKSVDEIYAMDTYAVKHGQKKYQPQAVPGDIKFVDTNNDGTISDSDMIPIGNGYPKATFGFSIDVSWKNLGLFVHGYGLLGSELLSYSAMRQTVMSSSDSFVPNILKSEYEKAWSWGNTYGTNPRLSINDTNWNMRCSDFWIRNSSYLKIDYIKLTYTIPCKIVNSLRIKSGKVFFSVDNLICISPYNKYGDPETGGNILYIGIDSGKYPSSKCYKIGAEFNF